jgi:hypothetical protein
MLIAFVGTCDRAPISTGFFDPSLEGPNIPARQLFIRADSINDEHGGLEDIRTRRFRYFANPSRRSYELRRKGRDLEVFRALLYMQTLFEAFPSSFDMSSWEFFSQPGRESAWNAFAEATENDTESLLRAHPYLRVRLSHLLVNCLAAAPPDIQADHSVRSVFGDYISVWP